MKLGARRDCPSPSRCALPAAPGKDQKPGALDGSRAATARNLQVSSLGSSFPKQDRGFGPRPGGGPHQPQDQGDPPRRSRCGTSRGLRGGYKGNLLVIPSRESCSYIRPMYLRARGRAEFPELKGGVGRRYQNHIVMGSDIECEALSKRALPERNGNGAPCKGAARQPAQPASGRNSGPRCAFHVARACRGGSSTTSVLWKAQTAGDWARYGEEIRSDGAKVLKNGSNRSGREGGCGRGARLAAHWWYGFVSGWFRTSRAGIGRRLGRSGGKAMVEKQGRPSGPSMPACVPRERIHAECLDRAEGRLRLGRLKRTLPTSAPDKILIGLDYTRERRRHEREKRTRSRGMRSCS